MRAVWQILVVKGLSERWVKGGSEALEEWHSEGQKGGGVAMRGRAET